MRIARGFTLLELMIAVAIVAILAAIALPSYSEYVQRSRITEAISALSSMQVKLEQFFQDHRSYDGACQANTVAPPPANTNTFTYACALTPTTYTVTATGAGPMTGFVYTVNQANTRATTGVPTGWATSASCWVIKKDGSC